MYVYARMHTHTPAIPHIRFWLFFVDSVAFSMVARIVAATERQQKEQNRAIYMLYVRCVCYM